MKLQTIVDIKPSDWKIGYEDKILMLGSCFADSIGEQMIRRNMQVTCNPFGTLYNPLSIAQAIHLPKTNEQLPLVAYEGMWHSMAHHGSFSRPTREEAEQAVKESMEAMQQALQDATVVIVTFGTAWVYEWNKERYAEGRRDNDNHVVANCHKLPAECFTRRRLSVEEILSVWQPILAQYPDKHWLFTVSPIRHIKDGLHENQLSKATLLQSVEELGDYFPSYEIMLDELRDYRFYADDLVHPSSVAVQYIWERFSETFCTPQTRNEMTLQLKQWKFAHHIPLH